MNNFNLTSPEGLSSAELLSLATDIVSAYLSNNTIEIEEISNVIEHVYHSLLRLTSQSSVGGARPDPAVPVNQSVNDEYLVCLEDGKQLKMLKRHLKSAYNMTPEQYRERWGLPSDYPMVAPSYARRRSSLAMEIGLGRKRKVAQAA